MSADTVAEHCSRNCSDSELKMSAAAAAAALQPSEVEWEKLVCAMFTGAELYDRNGEPLVEGSIKSILKDYGSRGTFTDPSRPYYLPCVAALYQENNKGVIVGKVLVSDNGIRTHVEKQPIAMSSEHLCAIHSI